MRLINTGIGEVSDRLSILALKILYGRASEKDVTHFETEQTALLGSVRARTLNAAWFASYTELAAVNAALWHAEDALRHYRLVARVGDGAIVECAFLIQQLNDRRAELIALINRDAGEASGAEKI